LRIFEDGRALQMSLVNDTTCGSALPFVHMISTDGVGGTLVPFTSVATTSYGMPDHSRASVTV